LNQYSEARRSFERALVLNPDDPQARKGLIALEGKGGAGKTLAVNMKR